MECRLVEKVVGYPGACVITEDADGPFVETDRGVKYQGARFVVSVKLVEKLAACAGVALSPEQRRDIELLEEEVEQLRAFKAAAEADLEEYERLRGSLAAILRSGAEVDSRKRIVPRAWPGTKRPDLDRMLATQRVALQREGGVLEVVAES